jgi:hypothetical protein
MKHYLTILVCLFFIIGCSGEKTDHVLLELDKKKLEENINYDKIMFYKFAKIAVRATAIEDTSSIEYKRFAVQFRSIISTMKKLDTNNKKSISVMDAMRLYKEYRSVKSFVKTTDEDQYPTLANGFLTIYTGQKLPAFGENKDKIQFQNVEHAVLSIIVLATRDLGQPFALYECSKTQPELLRDCEVKTLLEFVRGFLFFGNKLFYLSEDGLSRNLKWLDKNENIELPYTKAFFGWRNLSNQQTHTAFHGMNYLFRGFDRMQMDRKIDEERSLEDFDSFLKDMDKLGLQNELIWTIDAYLNLKRENPEKAIPALEKLKKSPMFSNDEREAIQSTINYVKDRKPDAALKGVYDKAFMTKIVSKYMIAVLSKIDWEKVMEENKVPHSAEIFTGIKKIQMMSNAVSDYTQPSALESGKKEISKKGSQLLEKAKGLW